MLPTGTALTATARSAMSYKADLVGGRTAVLRFTGRVIEFGDPYLEAASRACPHMEHLDQSDWAINPGTTADPTGVPRASTKTEPDPVTAQNRSAAKGYDAPFSNITPDEKAASDYWTHGVPSGCRATDDNFNRRRRCASLNAGTPTRAVLHSGRTIASSVIGMDPVREPD